MPSSVSEIWIGDEGGIFDDINQKTLIMFWRFEFEAPATM